MIININDYGDNFSANPEKNRGVKGLANFVNSLEFHYFSTVKLKHHYNAIDVDGFIIELNCNLNLVELLFHFNTGRWGNTQDSSKSLLKSLVSELERLNHTEYDIEELTIYLLDVAIVIKRIYSKSILDEFNDILNLIATNYVFLTKGLTQKPYEIFVPIVEDTLELEGQDIVHPNDLGKLSMTYNQFWAVYLNECEEAAIFDLQKNSYVSGDLDFYLED